MASASYLLPAELVTGGYYDERRVLQLVSDTGSDAVIANLEDDDHPAYIAAQRAIRWAASEVDSHCQRGKRYTRAALEAIVAAAEAAPADEGLQKRAAAILGLVADLAFGYLASRRGFAADTLAQMAPRYEAALLTLERLAQGLQIFDVDAALTAGAPSTVRIGRRGYRVGAYNRLFGVFSDSPRPYGGNYGSPWYC